MVLFPINSSSVYNFVPCTRKGTSLRGGANGVKWGKLPIVKCFPHEILSPFFPIFPHPCADFLLFFSLFPIAFLKCCTVIGKAVGYISAYYLPFSPFLSPFSTIFHLFSIAFLCSKISDKVIVYISAY